jgi:hypothetical protein
MSIRSQGALGLTLLLVCTPTPTQAEHVRPHCILEGAAVRRMSDVQLYDSLANARDQDPHRFDRNHHLLGRLLSDERFFQSVYHREVLHAGGMNHHPSLLWRILEGGEERRQLDAGRPHDPGSAPPQSARPSEPPHFSPLTVGSEHGPGSGPGTPPPGSSGDDPKPPSLKPAPEPSSFMLACLAGLGAIAFRRCWRRGERSG